MRIYLAGKVLKGKEIGSVKDWRLDFIEKLIPFNHFEFISPEDPTLDESKPFEIFGHDCFQIKNADLIIVNASSKLGVGTSQEMVFAKYFNKHVFTILPKDTHHRVSNLQMYDVLVSDWIHPFIYSMSDLIFDSQDQLVEYFKTHNVLEKFPIVKKINIVEEAIYNYQKGRTIEL